MPDLLLALDGVKGESSVPNRPTRKRLIPIGLMVAGLRRQDPAGGLCALACGPRCEPQQGLLRELQRHGVFESRALSLPTLQHRGLSLIGLLVRDGAQAGIASAALLIMADALPDAALLPAVGHMRDCGARMRLPAGVDVLLARAPGPAFDRSHDRWIELTSFSNG